MAIVRRVRSVLRDVPVLLVGGPLLVLVAAWIRVNVVSLVGSPLAFAIISIAIFGVSIVALQMLPWGGVLHGRSLPSSRTVTAVLTITIALWFFSTSLSRLDLCLTAALAAVVLHSYVLYRRQRDLVKLMEALHKGQLDVRLSSRGELARAFNATIDDLVRLHDDVRRQERRIMFGRIAAGFVHDLSHPIQSIANSCKLMVKMWDNAEYRDTFRRMIEREMGVIKRVLEDLQNIAKPLTSERFPLEINETIREAVDSMQGLAFAAGVALKLELVADETYIEGDAFALKRLYSNLIINALQATGPGGLIVVATDKIGNDRVELAVRDTGSGIPPSQLETIFQDFVTTKRRGLGLGLAVSRTIVDFHRGRITVQSEVGKGSTFRVEFPLTDARPEARLQEWENKAAG